MRVCAHVYGCPRRPEGVIVPKAGVTSFVSREKILGAEDMTQKGKELAALPKDRVWVP